MQQPPTHVVGYAKLLTFPRVTARLFTSYSSMEFFTLSLSQAKFNLSHATLWNSFSQFLCLHGQIYQLICIWHNPVGPATTPTKQSALHHFNKNTATMQGTKFDHCRILVEVITSWTQKHRNLYSTGIYMMPHSKSYKSKLPKARPGLPLSSWFAQCCCQTHGQSVISTSLKLFKMN